jgi:hypothetical protein
MTPTESWRKNGSYDALEHLRRSLFLRRADVMARFSIYCDASGGDPKQTVFTVGGVIADVSQWEMFNEQWPSVLANGPRPEYHATDVEDSERLWGWSKEHKKAFQRYAYSVVKLRAKVGISCTLIKEDFEAERIRWHKIPHGKSANYLYFCVNDVIKQVTDWALERDYYDPINYVFECGDLGQGEVAAVFAELPQDPDFEKERRELIGTVSFGKKQRLFPLQAADIWTYENYKQMINQHMPLRPGDKKRDPRVGYAILMQPWWEKFNTYWDRKALKEFAERARALQP